LQVGNTAIPATTHERLMRVRFTPPNINRTVISMKRLLEEPALASQFAGTAVFIGVTARTEHDRLFTPYGSTSGTEINADAFETMARQAFITNVQPYIA